METKEVHEARHKFMKKKEVNLLPSSAIKIAFEKKMHAGLAAMAFVPGLNEKIENLRTHKHHEEIMRKHMADRLESKALA